MESKAKLPGHPIHPMLIVFFPQGLPTTALAVGVHDLAHVGASGSLATRRVRG